MNGIRRNLLEKNTGCTEETSRDSPILGGAIVLCCCCFWVANGIGDERDVGGGMRNGARAAESTDCMPIYCDKVIDEVTREKLVVCGC